jgi:hypothetical protein
MFWAAQRGTTGGSALTSGYLLVETQRAATRPAIELGRAVAEGA